jgi:hypothetical protein
MSDPRLEEALTRLGQIAENLSDELRLTRARTTSAPPTIDGNNGRSGGHTSGAMSVARNPPASVRSLPQIEELPRTPEGGFDPQSVAEAFDAFRRNAMQMSAELRVVRAASGRAPVPVAPQAAAQPPVGYEARMSAMRIIRAAAEFADAIEREAQRTAAAHLSRVEDRDSLTREAQAQAAQIVAAAKREADEVLARSRRDADGLSENMQKDVDETLNWARAQAASILARVQEVARELLSAASDGPSRVDEVTDAIVRAAQASTVKSLGPPPPLSAPLYESLEAARQNAATPPPAPDDTTW